MKPNATVICAFCSLPTQVPAKRVPWYAAHGWNFFCSSACRNGYKRKGRAVPCLKCGKEVWDRPGDPRRYCSKSCASSVNNAKRGKGELHPCYRNGKSSYRVAALRFYGERCSADQCPFARWGYPVPGYMLDVHHVDSNRQNNALENLQVLCVWCHALETRNERTPGCPGVPKDSERQDLNLRPGASEASALPT